MYLMHPAQEAHSAIPAEHLRQPETMEEEQLRQLQHSPKAFMGFTRTNSPLYNAVIISLSTLIETFNRPIFRPGTVNIEKMKDFSNAIKNIQMLYNNLVVNCSTYLREKEGYKFTSGGEARFNLIEKICSNTIRDLEFLNKNFGRILFYPPYLLNSNLTYKDILRDIRTEIIDITGRRDIHSTGGNTSSVLVIGEGERQRFFKEENALLDPYHDSGSLDPQEPGISDLEKEMRKKKCQFNLGTIGAKIRAGEEMSKRNVATSRLATVLGSPDLVVKASSATIAERGKPPRLGIIMSKARGKSTVLLNDLREVIDHGFSVVLEIVPEVKRQFANLQLLDWISGQIDRHEGNYCIDHEIYEGTNDRGAPSLRIRVLSIEGIDNDMAFGEISAEDLREEMRGVAFYSNEAGKTISGNQLLPRLRSKLLTNLPYIDEDFAVRILALFKSQEMIELTFGDLLSTEEINALKDRLAGVASALRSYPKGRLLKKDQWSRADAGECFDIHPKYNYLSRFIHSLIRYKNELLP